MKAIAQLKLNSIAIISLLTALLGFTYNTLQTSWIEENATRRDATFETLLALGELQEIVNYAHYSVDASAGDPIAGWSKVLLVKDLTILIKPKDEAALSDLFDVWQSEFAGLEDAAAEKKVSAAISRARASCLDVLREL